MMDTGTVILCTIVVEVFLAVLLATYWMVQSTYPGFSVSFLSLLTFAAGQTASLFLEDVLPDSGRETRSQKIEWYRYRNIHMRRLIRAPVRTLPAAKDPHGAHSPHDGPLAG